MAVDQNKHPDGALASRVEEAITWGKAGGSVVALDPNTWKRQTMYLSDEGSIRALAADPSRAGLIWGVLINAGKADGKFVPLEYAERVKNRNGDWVIRLKEGSVLPERKPPAPKEAKRMVKAETAAPSRSVKPAAVAREEERIREHLAAVLEDALKIAAHGRAVVPMNRMTMKPFERFGWGMASVAPLSVRQMFEEVATGLPLVGVAFDSMEDGVALSPHNREQYLNPKPTPEEEKEKRIHRFDAIPDFSAFMAAEHPRPESMVGSIIRARDFVMIYGKPYSGKSWLTVQLAVAVASGTPWLGLPTKAGRVGIVSREIEAGDLQARCRTILEREKIEGDLPIFCAVYPYIEGPVDLVDDHEGLLAFCERCKLDVLVLDPLSRLHRTDENSEEKMKPVLASIDALREKRGVTAILVHHERKSKQGGHGDHDLDAAAGTRSFGANPTVNMRIRELSEKIRRLSFFANHAPDTEPVYIRPVEGGGFERTEAPMTRMETKKGNKARIVELVRERPGVSCDELATETGVTRRTVERYLQELQAAGEIGQGERGPRGKRCFQPTLDDPDEV